MENIDLINSFTEFRDDKRIDKVTLMSLIESAFKTILFKEYGSIDNFDIIVNPDKGDLVIYRNRVVVEDGNITDGNEEISLSDAKLIEDDFEVGEDVSEEIKLSQLDRRAILSLRQILVSKINEFNNTNNYKLFNDLIGELYSAEVHYVKHNVIILLDSDGNEILLPRENKIPSDFFRKGDMVKGLIEKVELIGNKTRIIMTRTSPLFVERLFEQEIPEIFDGLITIKKVSRIPGSKAKVIVDTYDDRIDPVGACIGTRGSHIQGVVRELGNENIDVINYTNNIELLITRALNPAKVMYMNIDHESKSVIVTMEPGEIPKAIGKGGVNIRLASMVTEYKIDVISEGQEEDVELTEFKDEIEAWVIGEFKKEGLDTAKSILDYDIEDLVRRVDLEKETIENVVKILESEFKK